MITVTAEAMKKAYELLCCVSFNEQKLPSASKIEFIAKPLKDHHGYCIFDGKKTQIFIDSGITSFGFFLEVMVHEMCHMVLDQYEACDHTEHDETFNALEAIVLDELGIENGGSS